jgi:hypothetical protein
MNSSLVTAVILVFLTLATWLGMRLQRSLPEQHFSADTKDTVKLAMGLVATMAALLLSLLVSSAKDSYDTVRDEMIQMAAKLSFIDRVLHLYGPEAEPLRKGFHSELKTSIPAIWSHAHGDAKTNTHQGDSLYLTLQQLTPANDLQRGLKDQAVDLAMELGQLRTLLRAQAVSSISIPLLTVLVCWLVIIFFSFSIFAPPNRTATLALVVSAVSVAGAMFLILEMDRPFTGLIQIPQEPMVNAMNQMGR